MLLTQYSNQSATVAKTALSVLVISAGVGLSTQVMAKDALHGTSWKTVDDETGKAKAIVDIKEVNGKLIGRINKLVDPARKNICSPCTGKYSGKSLKDVAIVWNLKPVGDGKYEHGTILDPKKNKTYKLNAELAKDGKELKLRGFVGMSLFGRTQTWYRVN